MNNDIIKREFELMDKFSDYRSFIGVARLLIHIFNTNEALFLSELIGEYKYWKTINSLSYDSILNRFCFFSSIRNIEDNTGFTEKQQRNYINNLKYFRVDVNTCPDELKPYIKIGLDENKKSFNYVSIIETKQMSMPSKRYFFINAEVLNIIAYDGVNYKYFVQDRFKHLYENNENLKDLPFNVVKQAKNKANSSDFNKNSDNSTTYENKGKNEPKNDVVEPFKSDKANDSFVNNADNEKGYNYENVANFQDLTKGKTKTLQKVSSSKINENEPKNEEMAKNQDLTKSQFKTLQKESLDMTKGNIRTDNMGSNSINNNQYNKKNDNNSIHFNSISDEEKEKNEEIYQIFIKNINANGLYISSNCELRTSEEKKICKGFVEFCEDVIKSSENREFLINNTKYLKKDVLDKIMKLDFDDFLFLVECYKNNNTEIINNNQYMLKMIWTCKMNNNTQFANRFKVWNNKLEEEKKKKEKIQESLVNRSSYDDNRYLYVVDGWEVMPHPMEFDISDNNCFIQEKMAIYNERPENERKDIFNAYQKFKKEYPFTKICEIEIDNDSYYINFSDKNIYLKDLEENKKELIEMEG